MSEFTNKPIKERLQKPFEIDDCDVGTSRIKTILYSVLVGCIILSSIFVGFLYIGSNCIIKFNLNKSDFDTNKYTFVPSVPILVGYGKYASVENATFSLKSISLNYLSDKIGSLVYDRELYFVQINTLRIVSDDLNRQYNNFAVSDPNVYVGATIWNTDNVTESKIFSIRLSADMKVLIKAVIYVNFTDESVADSLLTFQYIRNFGHVDVQQRPNGRLMVSLQRFSVLNISIKNFTILNSKMEDFFTTWTVESDVGSYPYILDLNLDYQFGIN